MSKRFFDTEMFNKVWFRKLKPKYKTFWFYVLCNCDIAGIWECDYEASQFFIGEDITEKDVLEQFSSQLLKIDDKRFIVKDFVEFQNGSVLNPKSPVHQKIINILTKYSLFDTLSNRVLYTQIVIVGVEVVVGEEVKAEVGQNFSFDEFWEAYDKKTGDKSKLEKKWSVLSDSDREKVMQHIPAYIASQPDKKFRKNPETYLNNKSWNDEVIYSETANPVQKTFNAYQELKTQYANE